MNRFRSSLISLIPFLMRRPMPATRTLMMGNTDAMDNIPKVSCTLMALPMPSPIASTIGTVTSLVVVPALSHATQVKASSETTCRVGSERGRSRRGQQCRHRESDCNGVGDEQHVPAANNKTQCMPGGAGKGGQGREDVRQVPALEDF